jgi:hypothetical protein
MAARDSFRVPKRVGLMLAKADGGWPREGPDWACEYELGGTL